MSAPMDVHRVPATAAGRRLHEMDDSCWCMPAIEYLCDGAVITHRENHREESGSGALWRNRSRRKVSGV